MDKWALCSLGVKQSFLPGLSSFLKSESFLYSLPDSHQSLCYTCVRAQTSINPLLAGNQARPGDPGLLSQPFHPWAPIPAIQSCSDDMCDSRAMQQARQMVRYPCGGWGWERAAFLDGSCLLNTKAFLCFLFQIKKAYKRGMFENWDKSSPLSLCLLGLLSGQWGSSQLCRSSGCITVCTSYGTLVLAGERRHIEVPGGRKFSISVNGTASLSVFFSILCSLVPSFTKTWSAYYAGTLL